MLNMTKDEVIKYMSIYDTNIISYKTEKPRAVFEAIYEDKVGKKEFIGNGLFGIIEGYEYFDKSSPQFGQVTLRLPYKIELKEDLNE